jgi:hypothetical protein
MTISNPRIRVSLPSLNAYDALLLVNVLERFISALWRAHGDHMAEILARRGVTTVKPDDAGSQALDLDLDLDEII